MQYCLFISALNVSEQFSLAFLSNVDVRHLLFACYIPGSWWKSALFLVEQCTLILLFLFVLFFPVGHCCLAFIFTPFVCLKKYCMQQQNCICRKVAREKNIEKHEIFEFTVNSFHCLNFHKTAQCLGIHLSFPPGLVDILKEVSRKNGRALRICREGRKLSSNEHLSLPVWFSFCSCTAWVLTWYAYLSDSQKTGEEDDMG